MGRTNWASHVRLLLHRYGFGYAWVAQDIGNTDTCISLFQQRLADCLRQDWSRDIDPPEGAICIKISKPCLMLNAISHATCLITLGKQCQTLDVPTITFVLKSVDILVLKDIFDFVNIVFYTMDWK